MYVIFAIFLLCFHHLIVSGVEPDQCDGKASQNTCGMNNKFDNTLHYNIILIGATGNLATKYLWSALLEFFIEQSSMSEKYSFRIYAASRDATDEGRKFLSHLFIDSLKCRDELCKKHKKAFVEAVQYVRLRTTKDFKHLESLLDENTQTMFGLDEQGPSTYEVGRLFYLSIPPSAYATTSSKVHEFLRPKLGRPWVRLVIEKPFGLDIASAESLAIELAKYFKEEEILRVDHYLAKSVVQQIIHFRYTNKEDYDVIWNRKHIEKIEIVMKEKEDVNGRTSFYDETGVIRDVFQNHLTELLALIAMELPEDSGRINDVINSKVHLMKQVEPLNGMNLITGQYSTYNLELIGQNNLSSSHVSHTPTYAAVVVHVNNDRWEGVPFVLMSGKKLDEKSSYININFRQNRFCTRKNEEDCLDRQFIHFRINGDKLPFLTSTEFIATSNSLPKLKFFGDWNKQEVTGSQRDDEDDNETGHIASHKSKKIKYFGIDPSDLKIYAPKNPNTAYKAIISAAIDGLRHQFVSRDFLMQSWNMWDHIAKHAHVRRPRQYLGRGKDSERLDFLLSDRFIDFYFDNKNINSNGTTSFDWANEESSNLYHAKQILNIGDTESVTQKLAMEIIKDINFALGNRTQFHMAVSGGDTPISLLRRICTMTRNWRHVHIWQVDERCTTDKNQQNFHTIEKHLFRDCGIPYSNIHPISPFPTCPPGSAAAYTSLILGNINNASFDLVLLGLGSDGHVASIFPTSAAAGVDSLTYEKREVENPNELDDLMRDSKPNLDDKLVGYSISNNLRRISLSLTVINRCKKCVIYVTGVEKSGIVAKVMVGKEIDNLPVGKVKPIFGQLEWFLDTDAFSKTKNNI